MENHWNFFLPMVKLELSKENSDFGTLISAILTLTASQYLKDFRDEIGSNLNEYSRFDIV